VRYLRNDLVQKHKMRLEAEEKAKKEKDESSF
jgi:hypothetical protein